MSGLTPGIRALLLVAGLSGSAFAQGTVSGRGADGFATFPGPGTNQGFYSINNGFGTYGLPGSSPSYGGYGLPGYGPGSSIGSYYNWSTDWIPPKNKTNVTNTINSAPKKAGKPLTDRKVPPKSGSQPRRGL